MSKFFDTLRNIVLGESNVVSLDKWRELKHAPVDRPKPKHPDSLGSRGSVFDTPTGYGKTAKYGDDLKFATVNTYHIHPEGKKLLGSLAYEREETETPREFSNRILSVVEPKSYPHLFKGQEPDRYTGDPLDLHNDMRYFEEHEPNIASGPIYEHEYHLGGHEADHGVHHFIIFHKSAPKDWG